MEFGRGLNNLLYGRPTSRTGPLDHNRTLIGQSPVSESARPTTRHSVQSSVHSRPHVRTLPYVHTCRILGPVYPSSVFPDRPLTLAPPLTSFSLSSHNHRSNLGLPLPDLGSGRCGSRHNPWVRCTIGPWFLS